MKKNSGYSRFQQEQLTLRDELAVDRTVLANERTMLAYVRTALGFLILGLTFLHFLKEAIYRAAGYMFIGVAAMVLLIGMVRFIWTRIELGQIQRNATEEKGDDRSARG